MFFLELFKKDCHERTWQLQHLLELKRIFKKEETPLVGRVFMRIQAG